MVLRATPGGMEDFVGIGLWGEHRTDFPRRFPARERGIPSRDTLNDVMNGPDPALFRACLAARAEGPCDSTPDSIAGTIVKRGGDPPALKPDRTLLSAGVEAVLDGPEAGSLDTRDTTGADHGRPEIRRHAVCHHLDWLFCDRRCPGEPGFPHLAMIARVQTGVRRSATIEHESRYSPSRARLDARTLARAARDHRCTENRLHRVPDVVFHDDLAGPRSGHGPENMAVVRHMAINPVREPEDRHSLRNRGKPANPNPESLETLIRKNKALT